MKNLMILSMILLLAVSCSSFPVSKPIEVCAMNIKSDLRDKPVYDLALLFKMCKIESAHKIGADLRISTESLVYENEEISNYCEEAISSLNKPQSYCRCAKFDFNYGLLKATGPSYNKPINQCHKYIGMSGQGWIDLIHYIDSIYVWKDKHKYFKSDRKEENGLIEDLPDLSREVYWHQSPLNLLH